MRAARDGTGRPREAGERFDPRWVALMCGYVNPLRYTIKHIAISALHSGNRAIKPEKHRLQDSCRRELVGFSFCTTREPHRRMLAASPLLHRQPVVFAQPISRTATLNMAAEDLSAEDPRARILRAVRQRSDAEDQNAPALPIESTSVPDDLSPRDRVMRAVRQDAEKMRRLERREQVLKSVRQTQQIELSTAMVPALNVYQAPSSSFGTPAVQPVPKSKTWRESLVERRSAALMQGGETRPSPTAKATLAQVLLAVRQPTDDTPPTSAMVPTAPTQSLVPQYRTIAPAKTWREALAEKRQLAFRNPPTLPAASDEPSSSPIVPAAAYPSASLAPPQETSWRRSFNGKVAPASPVKPAEEEGSPPVDAVEAQSEPADAMGVVVPTDPLDSTTKTDESEAAQQEKASPVVAEVAEVAAKEATVVAKEATVVARAVKVEKPLETEFAEAAAAVTETVAAKRTAVTEAVSAKGEVEMKKAEEETQEAEEDGEWVAVKMAAEEDDAASVEVWYGTGI